MNVSICFFFTFSSGIECNKLLLNPRLALSTSYRRNSISLPSGLNTKDLDSIEEIEIENNIGHLVSFNA